MTERRRRLIGKTGSGAFIEIGKPQWEAAIGQGKTMRQLKDEAERTRRTAARKPTGAAKSAGRDGGVTRRRKSEDSDSTPPIPRRKPSRPSTTSSKSSRSASRSSSRTQVASAKPTKGSSDKPAKKASKQSTRKPANQRKEWDSGRKAVERRLRNRAGRDT